MKSRERFPPGGWKFFQPESKFNAPPNASFESVVQAIIQHRAGNQYLVQTHGWSVDPETVRNELDNYNATICQQMGWNDYIYTGGPDPAPPKTFPQQQRSSLPEKLAAGAETLVEWLGEGGVPVDKTLADKRAAICATCPKNSKDDFTRWFTIPVSEAIRMEIQRKGEMKLETPSDDRLGICSVCTCPMRLKVWTPLHNINNNMPADIKAALPPHCWVVKQDVI